jgi:hypothetical protein
MKALFLAFNILFLITQMSNSQVKDNSLEKFDWIIDNWIAGDENSITRERWTKESDTILRGKSYTIKSGDTVFSEQLSIEKRGDGIYYVAVVKHNPGPVDFKLTLLSERKAVFENPAHDFPQKITYIHEYDGSLFAQIEGINKEGKVIKADFLMKKER